MRALVVAIAVVLVAAPASADELPSGALGGVLCLNNGTGASAKVLGFGYCIGGMASWQPTTRGRRWGFTARISTLFGTSPQKWFFMSGTNSTAATLEELSTVQMDATIGLRLRPWSALDRFLTVRIGGQILRTNQPVPSRTSPGEERELYGAITSIGLDQYIASAAMLSIDVRYGTLFGDSPDQIALLAGIAVVGP